MAKSKESIHGLLKTVEQAKKEIENPVDFLNFLNSFGPRSIDKYVYAVISRERIIAHKKIRNIISEKDEEIAELKELAYVDSLTGLHNRRYFDDTINRETSLVDRNGGDLSLILLDIDYFKNFNDNHGHDAGDYVLNKLGEIVKKNTRNSDISCRYGGEEFAVILPGTNGEGAYTAAENLRRNIEEKVLHYEGRDLEKVTVSLGISKYLGTDIRTFFKNADDALYLAKEKGRNRVEKDKSAL